MSPPRIPGYKIKRLIGQGGMATVYLAEQEALGRDVAIKVMAPALTADATFTSRFLQEGATSANLFHPHIIKVFNSGVEDNHYYLVMEYLGGGTLKDRIATGLSVPEVIRLFRNVIDALRYAHEQGVIHRDIKSQNILLYDDGTPVLSDFGVAKAVSGNNALTQSGMVVGSPGYMSPEQLRGESLDARTDIYALGVLFFEMLTGQLPYQATDQFAIAYKHIHEPIPQLPAYLRVFQPLLDQTMAKSKEKRPVNASALLALLNQAEAQYRAITSDETHTIDSRELHIINAQKNLSGRGKLGLAALSLIVIIAGAWGYFTWIDNTNQLDEVKPAPLAEAAQRLLSEAERYKEEGDYKRSLEYIARALIIAPRSEQIMALQSDVLTQQADLHQRHAGAARLLEQARAAQLDQQWSRSLNLIVQGLQLAPQNTELLSLQTEVKTAQAEAQRQAEMERQRQEQQQRLARQVQQIVADANALRDQAEFRKSLAKLEEGLSLVPQNTQLQALHTEVSLQLAKHQQRQTEAEALLMQAQQAQADGELERALAMIEQGLALLPEQPKLLALRQTVTDQQAVQLRRQQSQQLLAQAEQFKQTQEYEQALQRIAQALALQPAELENAALLSLQTEVETAQAEAQHQAELERQRQEQQQRLARQVQQILLDANVLRDQAEFNKSLAKLAEGLRLAPQNAALKALHAEISTQLAERQQRQTEAETFLVQAQQAQANNQLERALVALEQGLTLLPEHAGLLALRLTVMEAQQAKQQRAEEVTRLQKQAEAAQSTKQWARGLELVTQGLELAPENAELLSLRTELQVVQQRQQQAQQLLEQAQRLGQAQEYEQGLKRIAQALALQPVEPERTALQAVRQQLQSAWEAQRQAALERQQREEQRLERLTQAQELLSEATALHHQDKFEVSLAKLEQGLRLAPQNAELQALHAEISAQRAERQQRQREAETWLTQARQAHKQGELEDALTQIEQGLALLPEHTELLSLRQTVAEQQTAVRQQAELERQRQEEAQRQREQAKLLLARAQQMLIQGELARSAELIEQGLALTPSNVDLQTTRDRVVAAQKELLQQLTEIHELVEKEDISEGLQRIEQALAVFPTAPELVQLHQQLQKQQQLALARLEQETQPEQKIQDLLATAVAQIEKNRLTTPPGDNALETYRAVLALAPDNQPAQQGLQKIVDKYLDWALSNKDSGSYSKSLMYIRRGLDVLPEHAELLSLRSQVETLQNERAEAAKRVQAARVAAAAAARERARQEAERNQVVITRPVVQEPTPVQPTPPTIVRTTPPVQSTPIAPPPPPPVTRPPAKQPPTEREKPTKIFSTF